MNTTSAKLPNLEEIITILKSGSAASFKNKESQNLAFIEIEAWFKMYGEQIRNITLEWAAENAKSAAKFLQDEWGMNRTLVSVVDKQSILDGKTAKDLEI